MYDCVLLAAGEGQRAALGYNKVLYKINGQEELILFSLKYFLSDPDCKKIIIAISKRDELYFKNLIKNEKVTFTYGGSTRGESVKNALSEVESEYVIVHDGARPLVYREDIKNLLSAAKEVGGASLASKVYNTTCLQENGFVKEYYSRHTLASLITPQCFNSSKLKHAYETSTQEFTDDSSLFKTYAGDVKLVYTDNISIKVTTTYDIKLVEAIHANRKLYWFSSF